MIIVETCIRKIMKAVDVTKCNEQKDKTSAVGRAAIEMSLLDCWSTFLHIPVLLYYSFYFIMPLPLLNYIT